MTFDPAPNAAVDELVGFPGWSVPDGWRGRNVGHCRSCGAEVLWCDTRSHKRAPVNRDGTSHFSTCPQADAWRAGAGKAAVTEASGPTDRTEPVSRLRRQRYVEGEG